MRGACELEGIGFATSEGSLSLEAHPVAAQRPRTAAAIARLKEKMFDVLITDLKMKGPSGLEVLQFVRNQGEGAQVIIITGFTATVPFAGFSCLSSVRKNASAVRNA